MSSIANTKKAAPHRKAIAEAANMSQPGKSTVNNNQSTTKSMSRTTTKDVSASEMAAMSISNNNNEQTDDYETAKVVKNKKAQYDADIQSVMDLDRWG